jgi:hypothetical protein
LQIEYLLTPSVKQDRDPTALPAEPEFTNAVLVRAGQIADRQWGIVNQGGQP